MRARRQLGGRLEAELEHSLGDVGPLCPPRSRNLTVGELERCVAELAVRPEAWRPHVHHTRDRRHYVRLHRDPHLDVWLICWDAAQETGLHDHDRSAGAVQVVEGTLLEDSLQPRGTSLMLRTTTHPAGSVFCFDASHVHDVRHDGGPPATSIHAYSPALSRMGHYVLGEGGLSRVSVSTEGSSRVIHAGAAADAA